MVFPGARSKGCHRCRDRRIKCDERRPNCARCEIYGASCPGYYRPLELRFYSGPQMFDSSGNDETTNTCPPSCVGSSDDDDSAIEWVIEPGRRECSLQPGLQRQLQPLGDGEALGYFFHEFCIPPSPGIFIGFLNYIPGFLAAPKPSPALTASLLASATLSLSRHSNSTDLYLRAREYYGTALRDLSTALSNPSAAWSEETVVAILLLNLFEDFEGMSDSQTSHLNGIVDLIIARNVNAIEATLQHPAYGWAFTHLQIHTFITGQSFRCLQVPTSPLEEQNISPGMGLVTSRISQFCYEVADILQKAQNSSEECEQQLKIFRVQLQQAMLLQQRIENWYNSLSPTSRPTTKTAVDGKALFIFRTRLLGIIWPLYYCVLIFFYTAVLSCCHGILSMKEPAAGVKEADMTTTTALLAKNNILRLIDSICCSIAYNLGEVDEQGQVRTEPASKASSAYYLIWPLALVIQCRHSADEQSDICSETLRRIRIMYGIELVGTAMSVMKKKCGWLH